MRDEGCVEIKFPQGDAAILHLQIGQLFKTFEQRFGFIAAVRFDVSSHHVDVVRFLPARLAEHGIGFAHACRGAEENFEFASSRSRFLALHPGEQSVRIRA